MSIEARSRYGSSLGCCVNGTADANGDGKLALAAADERLRQRLADAEDDVKRLHNEKMDAIEENIKLRAALLDALTLCGVWEDDHPILQRARAALGKQR